MAPKGRKQKLDDALNKLGDEADYEKYRESARNLAQRMKIQLDELVEAGFTRDEAFQLLMGTPFGGEFIEGFDFLDDDEDDLP